MTSPPKMAVGLWSLYGGLFINFQMFKCLNVCPFDNTAIEGGRKVGSLNLRLTAPVG